MIGIINYGLGNLGSILNMLNHLAIPAMIIDDPGDLPKADKLILPGVGAFDLGMTELHRRGLVQPLNELVLVKKVPVLGICLGMQLITAGSEEGLEPGLGWVDGSSRKFVFNDPKIKIPHMGWNFVQPVTPSPLTEDIDDTYRFYFVHSYYIRMNNEQDTILSTTYFNTFTSGFQKENIFGVQFHPEKSHRFGKKLLTNFSRL